MRRSVGLVIPFVLAISAPLMLGATALPHLKLNRSFPSKDTTLTSAPDAVRLWMSEKADLPGTKITVTDAAKAVVPTAKLTRAAAADAPIEARFAQPVGAGVYSVQWKTMSKDGHVVSGTFGFTVKPAP